MKGMELSMVQKLMLSYMMLLEENFNVVQFNWTSSFLLDSTSNIEQVSLNMRKKKKRKKAMMQKERERKKKKFI